MSTALPGQPKKVRLEFTVSTDDQARELDAAWREILSGKRIRITQAAEDLEQTMERARIALQRITHAIEENFGSGQIRRLVRFLAGVYNSDDYPFELSDLRTLDADLASACIDYLNYDRLSKAEVHSHLPGGGEQLNKWIRKCGIRPRLRLSTYREQTARLDALAQRLDRSSDELLQEGLEEFLSRVEAKAFGCLRSTRKTEYGERPLVHAWRLTDAVERPLCGANDAPFISFAYDFSTLTCPDCRDIVLS